MERAGGVIIVSPEAYAERIMPMLVPPDLAGRGGAVFSSSAEAIWPSSGLLHSSHRDALLRKSEALASRALA